MRDAVLALMARLARRGESPRFGRFRIENARHVRVRENGGPWRDVLDAIVEPPARFVNEAARIRERAAKRADFKRRWNGAMSQTEAEDLFRLAAPEYELMLARRSYLGRNESDRKRVAERYIVACLRAVEGIPTEFGVDIVDAAAGAFEGHLDKHRKIITNAWATRDERPRRRRVVKK